MADNKKKVPMNHKLDEQPLLSNAQTVSHAPDRFVIDFKGTYPQFSESNSPLILVNHKSVLLDPYMAKEFLRIFEENVKKYEETYGEIKTPETIEKYKSMEKDALKNSERSVTSTDDSSKKPRYFG